MAKHITAAQLDTVADALAKKSDARFVKKTDAVPTATAKKTGGVKVGANLSMSSDGVLAVDEATEAEIDSIIAGTFS